MLFNSVGGCSLVLDLFIDCAGSSFLCADRNEVFFFFLVADKPRPRPSLQGTGFTLGFLLQSAWAHAHRLQ